MMSTTFQQDFVGSCTPVSEVQNGKNHRQRITTYGKVREFPLFSHKEMLREGTLA